MRRKSIAALLAAVLLTGCGNSIGENNSLAPLTTTTTTAAAETTTTTVTSAQPETTTTTTPPTETTTTTTALPEGVIPSYGEWASNNIIIADRYEGDKIRALLPFYSTDSIGVMYAEVINDYKEMVGEDVNVYNMSIPLASAFYLPESMSDAYADEDAAIENIGSALEGSIPNINLVPVLSNHLAEYIYSRTDHHWQPLGAYYSAQEFCRVADVPFADLSDYEECRIEDFCGTMYTFSGYIPELKQYPDTFTYYKPTNEYTTKYYDEAFTSGWEGDLFFDWVSGAGCYSAFLGGDLNIAEITTDVGNGRCCVLIKDSYGNALVPFLVGSFEKIYVVDFRYAEIGMEEFFEKVGATDILFGMSISSGYTPGQIESIQGIMR